MGVPHTPRYRHDAQDAKNVTACPMYVNISLDRCGLASGRSMTMAHKPNQVKVTPQSPLDLLLEAPHVHAIALRIEARVRFAIFCPDP